MSFKTPAQLADNKRLCNTRTVVFSIYAFVKLCFDIHRQILMLTIEMYIVCIVNIYFAIVVRGISPYFCNVKSCTPLLTIYQ